jgi:hypothetical protein
MVKEFEPGDIVKESGIYRVIHDKNHREPHDVTCVFGKKFPPCHNCEHPRFILKTSAVHIYDHPSFKVR